MNDLCKFLEWDSEFFQRRIASVTVQLLTPENLARIFAWCEQQQIDCLYFLASASDAETTRLAEQNHFQFVDIRLSLEAALPVSLSPARDTASAEVRVCQPEHLPALKAIARVNYGDTRFFYDRHFSPERASSLYEVWIEKSCDGFADIVYVALVDHQPAGYITCKINPDGDGQIGLVGVDKAYQGRGLGSQLLRASLGWFEAQGAQRASVVTQGRNVGAQRLYQNYGFLTRDIHLWYHRWFER